MDNPETASTNKAWFEQLSPQMTEQWQTFHDSVYVNGVLSPKTKELIAAASATVLRCRHCTNSHIQRALDKKATREEISEALMVAGLIASGSQLFWMKEDYEDLLGTDDEVYTPWFQAQTDQMGTDWRRYHKEVYEPSALDRKTKELIAAVCGTLLRCRHCTRAHIKKAEKHGASKQEISEAFMIGSLIASGSQLNWMREDYEKMLG